MASWLLVLRRLSWLCAVPRRGGILHYNPDQEKFKVVENAELTKRQMKALTYVEDRGMSKWLRTGIQQAFNTLVFKVLRMNIIYPVADESKLVDTHGNVLSNAYLMPPDSTPNDLSGEIHIGLVENYPRDRRDHGDEAPQGLSHEAQGHHQDNDPDTRQINLSEDSGSSQPCYKFFLTMDAVPLEPNDFRNTRHSP